jgi:hypothetical protein
MPAAAIIPVAVAFLLAKGADGKENHLALHKDTVHWGYFSKNEKPVMTIDSGEKITVEMATHHACDE